MNIFSKTNTNFMGGGHLAFMTPKTNPRFRGSQTICGITRNSTVFKRLKIFLQIIIGMYAYRNITRTFLLGAAIDFGLLTLIRRLFLFLLLYFNIDAARPMTSFAYASEPCKNLYSEFGSHGKCKEALTGIQAFFFWLRSFCKYPQRFSVPCTKCWRCHRTNRNRVHP